MPDNDQRLERVDLSPHDFQCMHCEYDLRGTDGQGQCPECGCKVIDSYKRHLELKNRPTITRMISYFIRRYPIPFTTYAIVGLLLYVIRIWWAPDYDAGLLAVFIVLGKPLWGFQYWLFGEMRWYSALNMSEWFPYPRLAAIIFGMALCITLDAVLLLIRRMFRMHRINRVTR